MNNNGLSATQLTHLSPRGRGEPVLERGQVVRILPVVSRLGAKLTAPLEGVEVVLPTQIVLQRSVGKKMVLDEGRQAFHFSLFSGLAQARERLSDAAIRIARDLGFINQVKVMGFEYESTPVVALKYDFIAANGNIMAPESLTRPSDLVWISFWSLSEPQLFVKTLREQFARIYGGDRQVQSFLSEYWTMGDVLEEEIPLSKFWTMSNVLKELPGLVNTQNWEHYLSI